MDEIKEEKFNIVEEISKIDLKNIKPSDLRNIIVTKKQADKKKKKNKIAKTSRKRNRK